MTIIGQYVSTVTAVFSGQHQAHIDNHTSVQPPSRIVYCFISIYRARQK